MALYRDDHQAALDRIEALERQLVEVEKLTHPDPNTEAPTPGNGVLYIAMLAAGAVGCGLLCGIVLLAGGSGMAVIGALVAFLLVLCFAARSMIVVGASSEALVFSGRKHVLEDGSVVGFRIEGAGYHLKWPIIEQVDRIDLTVQRVEVEISNAYSRGGIPLQLDCRAVIRISRDPKEIVNAVERFLGREQAEVRRVAKETLEGTLRGIIAASTPEEAHDHRLQLENELQAAVQEDFAKLGLKLEVFKVLSVSDEVGYLKARHNSPAGPASGS